MSDAEPTAPPVTPRRPSFVDIESVSRRFGEAAGVDGVSLTIQRGEIVALLGPSGCGKSTLLRLIAGFEEPSAGTIFVEGQSLAALPPYRRPVNMMFQSYALFPHLTVEENVAFGLRSQRGDRDAVDRRVTELLDLVRMADCRRRRPGQLSGGQQQRVALARSLAREPKLLLLDEPMAALDRKLRSEMQFELAEILRRVRITCLIVTHDPEEAMTMADRLVLMRAGRIVQSGQPQDVYQRPVDSFAAAFVGPVNLLPGELRGRTGDLARIALDATGHLVEAPAAPAAGDGERIMLAVRPERVLLRLAGPATRPWPGGLRGSVEDRAYLGSHTVYRIRLEGDAVVEAHQVGEGTVDLVPGAQVAVSWDARHARAVPP